MSCCISRLKINFLPVFLFYLAIFIPFFSFSQLVVKVEYTKKRILLHEKFNIIVIYSNEELKSVSNFPEIPDFIKENTTFKKNNNNYIVTQTYLPTKSGDFLLSNYSLGLNHINYKFKSFKINVSEKSIHIKKDSNQSIINKLPFSSSDLDAIFKVSCSKNKIFIGEGVKIDVSLLINKNNNAEINFVDLQNQIQSILTQIKPKRSWTEEIVSPSHIVTDAVKVKNKNYTRYLFYSGIFYPMDSSDIEIKSLKFKILKYKVRKTPQLIERIEDYTYLTSNNFKINVNSLPFHPIEEEIIPGIFTLMETVKPGKLLINKVFNYQFIINSKAGTSTIPLPLIHENSGCDVFPPKIYTKIINVNKDSSNYQKIFEYQIVFKNAGRHPLDSLFEWIYFNVNSHSYDTLRPKLIAEIFPGDNSDLKQKETFQSTFYKLMIKKASNKIRSKEKEDRIKTISNIAILLMLVGTVILILKK